MARKTFFTELSWAGKTGVLLLVIGSVSALAVFLLGGFSATPPDAVARRNLVEVLDAWIAQTTQEQMRATHPTVAFSDDNALESRLTKYEILQVTSAADKAYDFSVALTFATKAGQEKVVPRVYRISPGNTAEGKEVWSIVGRQK